MDGRLVRNERGVTLALMAITMFLTLGMAALAIDYGMVKSAKAEAQRAMDAAALAGGSALLIADPAINKTRVAHDRAMEYAAKHGVRGTTIDTATEVTVDVDLPNFNVKASWARSGMGLWFARTFGNGSVGLTATATAHREATNFAVCVKPVAIPDVWDNHAHLTGGGGKKGGTGSESEDLNGNHIWDYTDLNGNGLWDEGEAEPWTYDPSLGDNYTATVGYGSGYRNPYGTGSQVKVNDYGRQIMLTTFSPKDASVSSMYYSWGHTTDQTNADSIAAAIRGQRCEEAALNTNYAAANGGKIGPLQAAWADLIATDPSAAWNDGSNTVVGSTYGANWQTDSPRTVVVALYNPGLYANTPNANTLQFINLAKVWIDQRPCSGSPGTCKAPITARFLGFVNGGGATGTPVGTLVYHLVLIK
jgi:Flp pilus assembly protein TadG